MTAHLAQAAVAVPLLGAVLAFLLGRRNAGAYALAALGTLGGLVAAILLVAQQLTTPVAQHLVTVGSLPLGPALKAPLELRVTPTGALIAAVALFVATCVQMFARWYLFSDPRYRSFAATVSAFTAAMVLVVLSDDVLLTLVGWEVMAWCSYLLIGHESNQPGPRRAALKAFLVTRVADAPLVVGLAGLAMGARTTRISEIVTAWSTSNLDAHGTLRLVLLLGLVCGVLGKSAQLPFTDWLPDAMEGPTPASALIHAATMVAAGTVVLAQFLPLLAAEPTARLTLVIVAGATSVFAAVSAFAQVDIKRLLAWSTISQVGLMLLGLGALAPGEGADAALLHLVGHAFFKSLLFLLVGWLAVVVGSTLVTRMTGATRRLPKTFVPVTLALFTMAGLPPTVAFVSKDAMLENAVRSQSDGHVEGLVGFIMLALIIVGTAAYSARAWLILQHRTVLERRGERQVLTDSHTVRDVDIVEMLRSTPEVNEFGDEVDPIEEIEEDEVLPRPGVSVRLALWLLVLGGVFGGLLAFTPLFDIDTSHLNLAMMGASVLLIVATGLVVRIMSLGQLYGDAARRLPRHIPLAASRGFGVETLYRTLVTRPVLALARGVHRLDSGVDAAATRAPGALARAGKALDGVHGRRPATGLSWVIVGVVIASILGVTLW